MNLLFVENRYKTFTFEAVANLLKKEGHKVAFLVQNKLYKPKSEMRCFDIPFPSRKELSVDFGQNSDIEKIIESDRMINFFQKLNTDYFYYYNSKIEKIIDFYSPDIVFGEATAFHELLTINCCKRSNILYLNPSSCRYPKNRFSFYKYDSLEPFKGSDEILTNEVARSVINGIIGRQVKPDYMNIQKIDKFKVIKDKATKLKSYLYGDLYNTPNPIIKFKIEKQKASTIRSWDSIAKETIGKTDKFIILYPLQMQPEANIDVWGRKYRNQLQLIKNLSSILPSNAKLVIKPNPKSKYELSSKLVSFVENQPNILALQHKVKMEDILDEVDLVVTVTGTIAIECILANKPVVTLIETINNKNSNCIYVENLFENLPRIISDVVENKFPVLNEDSKIQFVNLLNQSSYKGNISDPFSDNSCLDDSNIDNILEAFKNVLSSYSVYRSK